MTSWIEIILAALNVIFAGGFILSVATLKSERRKRSAQADKVEIDTQAAQLALERMVDENDRAMFQRVLDESRRSGEALHRAQETINQLMAERTESILLINTLTRKLAIAEQTIIESPRCDILTCCKRMPPFKEAELCES